MRKRKVTPLQNQQGKWTIDFLDEFNKRRRMIVGDGTSEKAAKDEARRKARELNDKLATERNPDTASTATVLAAYFEGNQAFDTTGVLNRVSKLTAMKYHAVYGHFKRFFPGQVSAFRELTRYHVELYLTTRVNEGAAPKTISAEFICLRTLCRWAAQEHQDNGRHYFLKYDITADVRPPKIPERMPVYFTDDELARLFEKAKENKIVRAMICLGYYHALRTSSIARLKVADVELTGTTGTFKVWKKAGGQVAFNLHPDTVAALRECPPVAGSDYWFGDEWAGNSNQLSQYLCAWIRNNVSVNKRFHDLRHTTTHAHIVAGTPAPMIQRAMGHANLSTTQQYVRLWQHEVADVGLRLATVGSHAASTAKGSS